MTLVRAHTSIIGETGYNTHSRNFFKALNKFTRVMVRNWTIGENWKGYTNDEPHNLEPYVDEELKRMLVAQTLLTPSGPIDFPLYSQYHQKMNEPIFDIVLNDNQHPYFDQKFDSPAIAYNVWETTRQPEEFFEKLKNFTQVWVPSEWQKQCTIDQGIPEDRVKVVPEGVDESLFKPINDSIDFPKNRPLRFLVVGRWEYRKSTKEIIKAFIEAFPAQENVELILSVDNPFANDGLATTQERLDRFGLSDSRIKIVNRQSKDEYVSLLLSSDVFVSCARSEGWNLPLIEAMAAGLPALYSDWGAQLEFAKGRGIPVNVLGEVPAGVENQESWDSSAPGNFADPDFGHLVERLRAVYSNYSEFKQKALTDSVEIRTIFTWENAAKIAYDHIQELANPLIKEQMDDFAWVTCGNLGYMPIIEKLVQSLAKFSKRRILIYGIDCEVPFADSYSNVIARRLETSSHSIYDKWYWKQYACLESLTEPFNNFIWLDGDIVANHNIDSLSQYFGELHHYPLPDSHVQEDFIGFYTDSECQIKQQLFNQELCAKFGVERLSRKSHICMYLYNKRCKWWFTEILQIYKETSLEDYDRLLPWNDEGIDNFLRCKYKYSKMLPVSNFDVSEWDGDLLNVTGKSMEHFITFWRDKGPLNFGKIYGWQKVPSDKEKIAYFHGNKNLKFAQFMIEYIELQKNRTFHDSKLFFTSKNEVKNLGEIHDVSGSTIEIAAKYGWDYAIYHEIYNLKDYEFEDKVKIRPGDTVVDLGGNIGVFTRYAYHMGAERIVTFEPDRRYFEILQQNAPANAILFNAAIGDKLGKLVLTESSHLGGSNLWHQADPLQTQYEVNVYTLDYLLQNRVIDKIDFLKVDIEGSEIIAMQGISDENLSRIRNIAVEYHHEHLKFNDHLRHTFVERLNRLGFNSYMLMCGYNNALQLIYFWK